MAFNDVWMVFINFLMVFSDFSMGSEICSCFLSYYLSIMFINFFGGHSRMTRPMQCCRFNAVLRVYAMHDMHRLNM